MSMPMWCGRASRKINARIVVEGDLVLETPAHFGNGDGDDLTDMPLLFDAYDEADGKTSPLLTGSSIAGALRSYLRELAHGYGYEVPAKSESASVLLFGGVSGDDEGEQSPLIVDDAYGKDGGIEMRDGVKIEAKSRTAADKKKFDLQLWQAGTKFTLRFELLIRRIEKEDDKQQAYESVLTQALATALDGFSNGTITLGARKRRGYGRASIAEWRVKTYDVSDQSGLVDWIENGDKKLGDSNRIAAGQLSKSLGVTKLISDQRKTFHLDASFSLDGSLLIRSGGAQDFSAPDAVHLSARQSDGELKPILSGTSLGGALRARALKIANTIAGGHDRKPAGLINTIFGIEMNDRVEPCASRIQVEETVVEQPADALELVQNRVSIDRFTGGARDTALFNEQPIFGGDDTTVKVKLTLFNPACHEVGLLLLLLKDLWTSDLPLGGESSVGRGRLKGKEAKLTHRFDGKELTWTITADGDNGLSEIGDKTTLEMYVSALHTHLEA